MTSTPVPPTAGALPPPWRAGRSSTHATRQPEAGMRVELQVNGRTVEVDVEPRSTLLDCLRETWASRARTPAASTACAAPAPILVDGEPARSCLMLAVQADGHRLTTIEGLSPGPGELSVLQDAFCETHGLQCGYCTPGMILAGHALLARTLAADTRRHRRGHLRQPVPLHRLRPDRRGDRAGGRAPAQRQRQGRRGVSMGETRRPSSTSRASAACARIAGSLRDRRPTSAT